MAAPDVLQKFFEHITLAWTIPKVVMGIDDGSLGFKYLLADDFKPLWPDWNMSGRECLIGGWVCHGYWSQSSAVA